MDDNNNDNPTGKEDEPKDEPLKNLPEQPSDADDLAKENEGVDAPSQVVEEPATAQPQKSSEEEEASVDPFYEGRQDLLEDNPEGEGHEEEIAKAEGEPEQKNSPKDDNAEGISESRDGGTEAGELTEAMPSFNLVQNLYREIQELLEKGEYHQVIEQIQQAKADIRYWTGLIDKTAAEFENVYFEFLEGIEQSPFITTFKQTFTVPVDRKGSSRNMEIFRAVNEGLSTLLAAEPVEEEADGLRFRKALEGIPHANIASSMDILGYLALDESRIKPETAAAIQDSFSALQLILKKMYKTREHLLKTALWRIGCEKTMAKAVGWVDYHGVLNSLAGPGKEEEDWIAAFSQLKEEAQRIVQGNFHYYLELSDLVDKSRKTYFEFLNRRYFDIINDLRNSENSLGIDIDEQLEEWKVVFSGLQVLLAQYLEVKLGIHRINCEYGDTYDPALHVPYIEAEADEELENDQIKRVVHDGFRMEKGDEEIIIRPADVIVVNNDLK